jgi:hypothetical protein
MAVRIASFARRLLVLAAMFALSTGASALTLVSPNVTVSDADNILFCRAVNAGKATINVQFELLDQDGVVVASDDFAIAPGGTRALQLANAAAAVSCRFTGAFKRKGVRASIDIVSGGRTIAIAPAF